MRAAFASIAANTGLRSPGAASSLVGAALEPRKVLVIDIGGTSVKLLVSGQHERRMFPSGPKMMPDKMVRKTLEMVADWDYAVVSIGYPGPVLAGGRFVSHTIWVPDGSASILLLHSTARSRS